MPGSASARMGLQAIAGADAANTIDNTSQALVTALDGQTAIFSQGILASRPTSTVGTPGKTGRFYYATDTAQLFYDFGTGWKQVWPPEAGLITDAMVSASAAIALSKLAIRPMVRVTNSGGTSVGDGATVVLSWDTERHDTAGLHGANPSRLTAPLAGVYAIWARLQMGIPGVNNGYISAELRANGSEIIDADRRWAWSVGGSSAAQPTRLGLYTEYELAAGDYVECRVSQNTGAPVSVNVGASYSPEFGMSFLGRTS